MGNLTDFAALTLLAAKGKYLKKLILTGARDESILRAVGALRIIRGENTLQVETFHRDNKATHQNFPLGKTKEEDILLLLSAFQRANLITTAGEAEKKVNKKGETVLIGGEKLMRKLETAAPKVVETAGNNKEKNRILKGDEPFLKLLGVSDENGRVHDKKGPKFRQINRFLELIRDTLSYLPQKRIRICDLCCGKSYLSFAVYHYFANVLGMEVSMTGVDLKPDVIAYCNQVAKELCFDGLSFLCGDVAAYESEEKPQLVISLHACDTATDLVINKGLLWEASVILSTPCCHHELNHNLNCPTLDFIGEHSMLRQKFCDAATDALRLKRMEAHGYRVAALELIDPEDTPKNVMLRGLRQKHPSPEEKEKALAEYETARRFLLGGEPHGFA